jgi:hypothetical protein
MLTFAMLTLGLVFLWVPTKYWNYKKYFFHFQAQERKKLAERVTQAIYQAQSRGLKDLPNYSFYTELITDIQALSFQFGFSFHDFLREIKTSLAQDHRLAKQLEEQQKGLLMQCLLMIGIIWIFMLVSAQAISIKIENLILVIFGGWHLCGLLLVMGVSWRLHENLQQTLAPFFQHFYRVFFLMGRGVPINQIQKSAGNESNENALPTSKVSHPELLWLQQKWEQDCARFIATGLSIKSELRQSLDDLWSIKENWQTQQLQTLGMIKLVVFPVFFISTYFLFIWIFLFGRLGS